MKKPIKEEFDPFKPITIDDLGGDGKQIEPSDVEMDDPVDLDGDGDIEDTQGLDMADDEIDPVGDAAIDGAGINSGDLPQDDASGLPPAGTTAEPPTPIAPIAPEKQVKWTAVPQDNGDIWSQHVDGYVLRARPLSAKQGDKIKYTAQLFHDDKLLEKGVIWVPATGDAQAMLQNISDRILDRMGLVSHSLEQPQPDAEALAGQQQPPLDAGGVPGEDGGAAGGEEGGEDAEDTDEGDDGLQLSPEDKEALGEG